MSLQCVIVDCQRTANVLCHCCKENLCRSHYNEHDYLNSKLNLLADQIETFDRQLSVVDLKSYISNSTERIEQWRRESYKNIDDYCAEKYREIEERLMKVIRFQREKIEKLRSEMMEFVEKKQINLEIIEQLTLNLNRIEGEMNGIDEKHLSISSSPLFVEKSLVRIDEIPGRDFFQLSAMPKVFQSIPFTRQGVFIIAANDQHLLVHREPNLCLIDRNLRIEKQTAWNFGQIFDMCWSTVLKRFFVITANEIFLVGVENEIIVESVESTQKLQWLSCCCSSNSLFLTTNGRGSSICEFNLLNSFQAGKRWDPPESCERNERIHDMVYKQGRLLLVVDNSSTERVRLELRSATRLERLWSIFLDIPFQSKVLSLAVFDDDWLVVDGNSSRLFQVTMQGNIKSSCTYNPTPSCASRFAEKYIVISTIRALHFHKV